MHSSGHQYIFSHFFVVVVSNHAKQERNMVNKTEKSVEIYKRHFLFVQLKLTDGVKYVYCIKHAYKFLLREQVGFAAVF